MQRALAAALIKRGTSFIHNPGKSDDDKAAISVIMDLGAEVNIEKDIITIKSNGVNPVVDKLNCGESGLAIRMFTPIAALSKQEIIITGEGSLLNRPMNFFDSFFPQLNINVSSNNGKLPIKIKGPLQPTTIEVDGSLSSQFITGLIMAYSAAGAENVSINVNDLKSKAYIDLTLDVLRKFDLNVPDNKRYKQFIFSGKGPQLSSLTTHYIVERDWSSAAFFLVAGAIAGPIAITGLDLSSMQADKAVIEALMQANAGIAVEAKGIKIHPGMMDAFEFDAADCPDLFPPLVALAAYCKGTTTIKGVSRLVHKESNRAISLQQEFGKMGVQIRINDDEMKIVGAEKITGAKVHSHHDHRIAMACSIAALKANDETKIEAAQAISKSYPGFFNDLKSLGANVSLQ
jgi:3-phosphoshikimate 1-carboxyvinyltransferase